VGTGFHPELAGRENIYLNGAVLSLSKDREVHGYPGEALPFDVAQGKLQRHVRVPAVILSAHL